MSAFCVYINGTLSSTFQDSLEVAGGYAFFVSIDIAGKPGTTDSSVAITAFEKPDRKKKLSASILWAILDHKSEPGEEISSPNIYLSIRGTLV